MQHWAWQFKSSKAVQVVLKRIREWKKQKVELLAQLMEEADFAEDETNGYESDGSVDFENQ
jgi:hypothetical protein